MGAEAASPFWLPTAGWGHHHHLELSSVTPLAQLAGQAGKATGNRAECIALPRVEYWLPEPVTPVTVSVSVTAGETANEHFDHCCF